MLERKFCPVKILPERKFCLVKILFVCLVQLLLQRSHKLAGNSGSDMKHNQDNSMLITLKLDLNVRRRNLISLFHTCVKVVWITVLFPKFSGIFMFILQSTNSLLGIGIEKCTIFKTWCNSKFLSYKIYANRQNIPDFSPGMYELKKHDMSSESKC